MTCQDQFPDVSKIIMEQITLHPDTFCVDDLMDEMYHYVLRKLKNQGKPDIGVEILKYSDFEKCQICADRIRLRQILFNLLDNTVKCTENGYVFFGYRITNTNMIDFFVEDTGDGIPESQLPFIFKRFNHEEQDNDHLGLFVSRGLVQLMGGELNIESSDIAGETFSFSIACNPCEIA